jgi:lysophospholipase L1-like esterase
MVRLRNAITAVAKGLTTTLIFFVVIEVALRGAYIARNAMVRYVPLPYAFGDDYGPMPPWLDRLEILKNDSVLIWRNTPNVHRRYLDVFSPVHTEADRLALLRRFIPTLPAEFQGNHTWEVQLNSEGFRSADFAVGKAGAIRVACIGDSWTFGMPVNQDEAYPSRLAEWLRQERPDVRYDVENFGILGYTSFQGLQLMKTRVLDLNPDVVVIGFGMNDSNVAGYRDKDMIASGTPSLRARAKAALRDTATSLESYKLLKYEALKLRFHPKPVGEYLKAEAESKGSDPVDYESIEPWTRVSPHDYESNIREMARLAIEKGARVVLLDNELWDGSPYRPVLRRLSKELGLPLVDSLAIVSSARATIQRDLEAQLGLAVASASSTPASPTSGRTPVVFRVFRGATAVPRTFFIVGVDPQLGSRVPNTIAMHDDGTGGDERAGDGVWSYTASLPSGKSVFYVYTNSGTAGQWEGLDLPHIRTVEIPPVAGQPVYLPIDTFGRVYMQGDDWHTDKVGYDLIGHAVAREIESLH